MFLEQTSGMGWGYWYTCPQHWWRGGGEGGQIWNLKQNYILNILFLDHPDAYYICVLQYIYLFLVMISCFQSVGLHDILIRLFSVKCLILVNFFLQENIFYFVNCVLFYQQRTANVSQMSVSSLSCMISFLQCRF